MRFYHSGDLGDLVYAIPSIRALCPHGAEVFLGDRDWTRSRWTPSLVSAIEPLLRAQDCVKSVEVLPKTAIPAVPFVDFSTFRNAGYKLGDTIFERQRRWVRAPADISQPWLEVPEPFPIKKIVINRTSRWPGVGFPWKEIVRKLEPLFIGMPSEHEAFCREFGRVDYLPTFNLLDAARVVAASPFFIGNQSICGAIANGLHKPMLTEVCLFAPDCFLPRDNTFYSLDGAVDLEICGTRIQATAFSGRSLEYELFFKKACKAFAASKNLCSQVPVA